MDAEAYRSFLLSNLQDTKPASGTREVVCKCYYCNDNGDHHHMYISIPQNDSELSFFNCFKCGSKGIVTAAKLLEWSIFDYEFSYAISVHNNNVFKNPVNNKYSVTGIYRVFNTFIRNAEISEFKKNYINNRLGLDLSYQDLLDNKIVLNINDLLKSNRIDSITRSINFVNELNNSYAGFLSYDNGFLNLRRVNESSWIKDRYINYNIFDKQDNTMKFYINPSRIDMSRTVKVHMSEGPFDILSVKYNLRRDNDNCIYAAVAGNTYKGLIRNLIINLKIMDMEIHLYADNDPNQKTFRQNLSIINDLIEFLRPYKFPIYIHRNIKSKDMGVRLENIVETIEKVM